MICFVLRQHTGLSPKTELTVQAFALYCCPSIIERFIYQTTPMRLLILALRDNTLFNAEIRNNNAEMWLKCSAFLNLIFYHLFLHSALLFLHCSKAVLSTFRFLFQGLPLRIFPRRLSACPFCFVLHGVSYQAVCIK